MQAEYSYTRFVVERGGSYCLSIACDLEAGKYRIVRGKSEEDLSYDLRHRARPYRNTEGRNC